MAYEEGQTWRCVDGCGGEVTASKSGAGTLVCCDKEMELKVEEPEATEEAPKEEATVEGA